MDLKNDFDKENQIEALNEIDLKIKQLHKDYQKKFDNREDMTTFLFILRRFIKNRKSDIKDVRLSNKKEINEYWLNEYEKLEDFILFNDSKFRLPIEDEKQKTKIELLKENLYKYGFFELKKVDNLSELNRAILIQLISENRLPYVVAMFDYLDYFSYLERNHFETRQKLYVEVSKWFNSDKVGRAIKGNISSLMKTSMENKKRYTAFQHKEKVIKDYEGLK